MGRLSQIIAVFISIVVGSIAMAKKPNILVILTDDQGWGDLSAHGNKNLATPQIDSLARDGASFEQFFVCQVCAPTRAEFLTGRYYPRTGVSGVSRGQERLNPDETTIAELFQAAGYVTGAFGKWHNGTQPPYHPNHRGFDEFYGFTSGHWGHYFSPPLDHNGEKVRGNGFVVDDFTDHAIDFIRDNKNREFFCYLPLNTPHSPMMVPDRFYEKFADFDPPMRHREPQREDVMMTRAALAMVENIDWNVGRLLQSLDQLELAGDTIVVFFCDNGPNSYRFNGGMKGRKGSIDEGGLRSPLFIRWPGRIEPGAKIEPIAGAIDLLPTLTDLAEIGCETKKPIDGLSLRPLLLGESVKWKPRHLFAIKKNQVSVRTDRYRLDSSGKLFDIREDPGQTRDVSEQHPQLTAKLHRLAQRHAAAMKPEFDKYAERPFTIGFGKATILPARDGVPHGTIRRSAKAPNNSFFTHWTSKDDSITWDVDVVHAGNYQATIYYTCAEGNQGARIKLSMESNDVPTSAVEAPVTDVFDPPLYDKSKERVENSHYFVKDFKPLTLGMITSPTGYVASWIVKRLLDGGCTVHATVADPRDEQELKHLNQLADQSAGQIRFFPADPLVAGAYAEAMKGCRVVFHTASPVIFAAKKARRKLFEPAKLGTRNVMRQVDRTLSVQRVVFTSSCGAVFGDNVDLLETENGEFTEEDWNLTSSPTHRAYKHAVTLAEREAWGIANAQKRWDLVVLNPSLVFGPTIDPQSNSESCSLFKGICDGWMKWGVPDYSIGVVDVRDLAEAHVRAAWTPAACGRNIILGHHTNLLRIARRLNERFTLGFRFPRRTLPKWMVWLVGPAIDKSLTRYFVSKNIGYPFRANNTRSIEVLGMKYRRLDETVCDMFQQMIDQGTLKPHSRGPRRAHAAKRRSLFHDALG